MTIYVNLYGGPGVGKSTCAAYVFSHLKMKGYNVELVTEFAKDLVWTNDQETRLLNQYLIFGEQFERMRRVQNKVNVVVTDSPLLLAYIYGRHLGDSWKEVITSAMDNIGDNIHIILERNHPYVQEGRIHSESEALHVDQIITDLLVDKQYYRIPGYKEGFDQIVNLVDKHLKDTLS